MSLPIPAGTYGIDSWHSQLSFAIKHLGISTVNGRFDAYEGSLTVGEDLASTQVSISADMASVNSGNTMRDQHIQGPDFFDSENHPKLTFTSTGISGSGDNYQLTGDLTLRGVTKPVSLAVDFNGSNVFPVDQSTHFGFTATGSISRADFAMTYGAPLVLSDNVKLNLDVQFVKPA